jgi:hypothetical protein
MTANVGGSLELIGIRSETFCCRELRLTGLEGSNKVFIQFTSTLINIAEKMISKTCGKFKM